MIFLTLPVTGLSLGMTSSNPKQSGSCLKSLCCELWPHARHRLGITQWWSLKDKVMAHWWGNMRSLFDCRTCSADKLCAHRLEVWIFSQAGIFSDVGVNICIFYSVYPNIFLLSVISHMDQGEFKGTSVIHPQHRLSSTIPAQSVTLTWLLN